MGGFGGLPRPLLKAHRQRAGEKGAANLMRKVAGVAGIIGVEGVTRCGEEKLKIAR
jgi:hypothetical protein